LILNPRRNAVVRRRAFALVAKKSVLTAKSALRIAFASGHRLMSTDSHHKPHTSSPRALVTSAPRVFYFSLLPHGAIFLFPKRKVAKKKKAARLMPRQIIDLFAKIPIYPARQLLGNFLTLTSLNL